LLESVKPKADMHFFQRVSEERLRWDKMLDEQADITRSRDKIHPQAVARAASDCARSDAIFVMDTGLNTLWSGNWIRQSGMQHIVGSFNNAAVGTALGQANGIQALDRLRQVIVLTGDGGLNMLLGEFMTAVHHKLPVKVIVFNNSALGLITLEAESVGLVPFRQAIEFPNPDFAAFARACGGHGFTANEPGFLTAEINEALSVDGPAIVDCVVAADEMPNMPHVELEQVGHFALAKVKETVARFYGG
jgi:thiamine pyrophosphate-dependent acetolactate synthase large subunit-like protein